MVMTLGGASSLGVLLVDDFNWVARGYGRFYPTLGNFGARWGDSADNIVMQKWGSAGRHSVAQATPTPMTAQTVTRPLRRIPTDDLPMSELPQRSLENAARGRAP